MARLRAGAPLAVLLLVAAGCGPAADDAHDAPAAAATSDSPSAAAGATTGAAAADHDAHGEAADGHVAADGEGQALLPIMRRLGSEMTALTYALVTDDHATVSRSAAAIADHAPISAEELARIRAALGPDMAAFAAVDESVHVASVRLRDAAQAGRPDLVVDRLGDVQQGCVSCHVQFRDRLRTSPGGR